MKKILVEVNEFYLEECRKLLEHWWGIDVSNSQLVSHLLFLHHQVGFEKCRTCVSNVVKGEKK